MGYQVSSDLWTIFKNDLCEKRHPLKSIACQLMGLRCKSRPGGHRILVAKEEHQWIFTQDRWVEAISFRPVNKTCFRWNWPHVKETWTVEAGKEGRGENPPFSPSSLGINIASAKRSHTWWSRQHERCYICLSLFLSFFISLSAVSCEMDVSCHAPLPLFLHFERCPLISKFNF